MSSVPQLFESVSSVTGAVSGGYGTFRRCSLAEGSSSLGWALRGYGLVLVPDPSLSFLYMVEMDSLTFLFQLVVFSHTSPQLGILLESQINFLPPVASGPRVLSWQQKETNIPYGASAWPTLSFVIIPYLHIVNIIYYILYILSFIHTFSVPD